MTPGQRRTAKRLAIAGCIFLALVVWLLYSEARGLAEGAAQEATISELVWMAYAKQQWPFMLLGLAFAYVVGFISGHFFAQRASVYEDIRRGGETADAAALEAAAPKRAALERAYEAHEGAGIMVGVWGSDEDGWHAVGTKKGGK